MWGSPTAQATDRDSKIATLTSRIDGWDWRAIETSLNDSGVARLGRVLSAAQCAALRSAYDDQSAFRSRVVMARHGFGRGEYQYFAYPLPAVVNKLRTAVYRHAAPIANQWNALLGRDTQYPLTHRAMLERCHAAGQVRPTPLLLKYGQDDYNCLHQDVYGDYLFPLQLVVLLNDLNDFEGGEFVLTEQRPRMQSRVEVVSLARGEAALFAVRERPRKGTRGYHRVQMRHGVSILRRGNRFALGVIFHDAT